jgi:multicomponent Na+:H+ antiporter subunit D
VAVLTGMLTLYSMIKIWNEAFLKKQPENEYAKTPFKKLQFPEYFPSVLLGAVSILMGIFAFYVFDFTMEAGNQLTNPELYIETVLKRMNP